MKIISVQSRCGGTGVTLTAAELALKAKAEGKSIVAVDTCPMRHLRRDIERAEFNYLDDVRQLFRPMAEARWQLDDMPCHGLFHYPEEWSLYIASGDAGHIHMGCRARAGEGDDAANHLSVALTHLAAHYDVMIIDVENKNRRLMQLFHDVSDEVHVMLRANMGGAHINDWLSYIERDALPDAGPKIFGHEDRDAVPAEFDRWGNSAALRPFIEAAGAWRDQPNAPSFSPRRFAA